MPTYPLYPLKLQPALHVKVWGGRMLEEALNKRLPTADPYGESWELHDTVSVTNGPLAGTTLGELTQRYGAALIGDGNDPSEGFPLLAKFIHASQWLSIQVHPDDRQARELEGDPRGKTEAWVILQAAPGAKLVIGLEPGTSREQMAEAIRRNALEPLLVYAEVEAEDVLYIPANTVHALGPGLLIYEIQQASDITYRLYDWGRLGLDGMPRDLHIDKGVHVANLEALPRVEKRSGDLLVDGDYFRTWRHQVDGDTLQINTEGRFQCLTCIGGELFIRSDDGSEIGLSLGETVLIPASLAAVELRGRGKVLRSCQR